MRRIDPWLQPWLHYAVCKGPTEQRPWLGHGWTRPFGWVMVAQGHQSRALNAAQWSGWCTWSGPEAPAALLVWLCRASRARAANMTSKEDQKFRELVSQEILDTSPGVSWGSIAGEAVLQGGSRCRHQRGKGPGTRGRMARKSMHMHMHVIRTGWCRHCGCFRGVTPTALHQSRRTNSYI